MTWRMVTSENKYAEITALLRADFRIIDYLRKHHSQICHQTVDIADYENNLSDVTEVTSDNESINELLKEVGKQMGMNESAIKVAMQKMREKFGT